VPPNIADSRENRIQGPFLTPARFPHRRKRDSRGCFHTPRPNWPARSTCRQPGADSRCCRWAVWLPGPPAGPCGRLRVLASAGASWLCSSTRPGRGGHVGRRREHDLRTWLRSSTTCWLPAGAGASRPACSDVPVAGEVPIRDLRGTLGSAAEHSRRQMANWTCLARRGCRPAGAAVRRPVPPVGGGQGPGAGHL